MTTPKVQIPPAALHGIASYEKHGVLHHAGPFGVAVEHENGWTLGGIVMRIDEGDAVAVVATGAPQPAAFGPVLIIGGKHRGKLGYYDDEEDGGRVAIVYFGEPLGDDYALVPMRHVVAVDVTLMSLERYRREAPGVYAMMGLPSKPDVASMADDGNTARSLGVVDGDPL